MSRLPSHSVALSAAQKLAVGVGAAVGALLRPERADLVAAVAETTGEQAFRRMRQRMLQSEEGRQILRHVEQSQAGGLVRCLAVGEEVLHLCAPSRNVAPLDGFVGRECVCNWST